VAAALIYGKLVAAALARGRPPTVGDAQIAAVAQRDGMAVASRDIRGFDSLDVSIIDPWQGG
jgi:toxin FitB